MAGASRCLESEAREISEMMTVNEFVLFAILAIGFRWFVFESKPCQWLRKVIKMFGKLGEHLLRCPYCQTIECATFLFIYEQTIFGISSDIWMAPFYILGAGLCGVTTAYATNFLIDLWEQNHE